MHVTCTPHFYPFAFVAPCSTYYIASVCIMLINNTFSLSRLSLFMSMHCYTEFPFNIYLQSFMFPCWPSDVLQYMYELRSFLKAVGMLISTNKIKNILVFSKEGFRAHSLKMTFVMNKFHVYERHMGYNSLSICLEYLCSLENLCFFMRCCCSICSSLLLQKRERSLLTLPRTQTHTHTYTRHTNVVRHA